VVIGLVELLVGGKGGVFVGEEEITFFLLPFFCASAPTERSQTRLT